MHLAPSDTAGYGDMCPGASEACRNLCLHYSGNPLALAGKLRARAERTQDFMTDRKAFIAQLYKELTAFEAKAAKLGLKAAARLDGTSDTGLGRRVAKDFPNIQFYDYTKVLARLDKSRLWPVNYHLTYSASERVSDGDIENLVNGGINVAVVFRKKIPAKFLGFDVIDGTEHDLRHLDPKGVIVGLVALGRAKTDHSGFVRDVA